MAMQSLLKAQFNAIGVLGADVEATVDELEQSWLVSGAGLGIRDWDSNGRGLLARNLRIVTDQFLQAGGVREIWINGSFVEDNPSPGDIDGYFLLDDNHDWYSRNFQHRLAEIDGAWSWASEHRRRCKSPEKKPPFWCRYKVELYPDLGISSDILGPEGTPLTYADAFRQRTSTFEPKGIIRLKL